MRSQSSTTWVSTPSRAWPSTPARWTLNALLVCALAASLSAQQPAAPATAPPATDDVRNALPPSAILEQTMEPFDAVRADIANWSDVEQGALAVSIRIAGVECKRLEATPHEGEELFALAKLCSTGIDWPGAYSAATRYVRDDKAEHLVAAYGLIAQADLNLQSFGDLLGKFKELVVRVPYKEDVDSVLRYSIFFTDVPQPGVALALQQLWQPYLLAAIKAKEHATGDIHPGEAEARAIHLLELMRFNDQPSEAIAAASGAIESAAAERTLSLSPLEQYQISLARKRYNAIGHPMPAIKVVSSSYDKPFTQATPRIRMLVVYPQNCVSCGQVTDAVDKLRMRLNQSAEAWVVEDASGLNTAIPGQKPGTGHRLTTSTALLDELGASGSPFYVVTDAKGNIGFLAQGSPTWLVPKIDDSIAEVIMNRVANYTHTGIE